MASKKHRHGGGDAGGDVIAVSAFKVRCLEIIEALQTSGREVVLAKNGVPIARVVPVTSQPRPLRGLLKGQMEILGDIVHADLSDDWAATR